MQHFISHQTHQNKATLIQQVTRIQYSACVVYTERKAAAKLSHHVQNGEMAQAVLLCVGQSPAKQPVVTIHGCRDGGVRLSSAWATAYLGWMLCCLYILLGVSTQFPPCSLRSIPIMFRKFPFPLISGKTIHQSIHNTLSDGPEAVPAAQVPAPTPRAVPRK